MANRPFDLQRRHAELVSGERLLWVDWERAHKEYVDATGRLGRGRALWEARITGAMRGVRPETWWRINARIEAVGLRSGGGAVARRNQRVVRITRREVVELAARRDADLAAAAAERTAAEGRLRSATRKLVGVFGKDRVAALLGLPPATVRALCSNLTMSASQSKALTERE